MSELLFQLLDFYKYMQKEREVKREERKEGRKFTDKIDLSSPPHTFIKLASSRNKKLAQTLSLICKLMYTSSYASIY